MGPSCSWLLMNPNTLGSRYTDCPYNETPKSVMRYTDWFLTDWAGYTDSLSAAVRITRSGVPDGPKPQRNQAFLMEGCLILLKSAWIMLSKEWSGIFVALFVHKLFLVFSKLDCCMVMDLVIRTGLFWAVRITRSAKAWLYGLGSVRITRSTWLYWVRITRPQCISDVTLN